MRTRHFTAMLRARTMEFVRDRETLVWNLALPILLVFGFAFAFSGNGDKVFKVGVVGEATGNFASISQIDFVHYDKDQSADAGLTKALEKLRQHQIDLVVDYRDKHYWTNEESGKSVVAKKLFDSSETSGGASSFVEDKVTGQAIRYVDWLVPGIIGMNIMFSSLFGVGYVIVRYRKNGVLKRFKASPVSPLAFVSAQAISRLLIVVVSSVLVFLGTDLALGFMMKGSALLLFLVLVLGVLSMIGIGLIFAARLRSEELANGLMNLLTFPMLLGSGVFFSLEGTPQIVQTIGKIFPLTHFIDASRAIMLDGAGLVQILPQIFALGGTTAVAFAIASFLFRWD